MNNNLALIPSKEEFNMMESIAKYAAESPYFKNIGGVPGAMCIAMYAREIGIPPMTAIMGALQNIMGKIQISPEACHGLIRASGHHIEVKRHDNEACTIYAKRKDTGNDITCTFTIEDARKANLIKNGGGYDKTPSDMLFARCIGRVKRRLFPDIANKAYVVGETEEEAEKESKIHPMPTLEVDPETGEVKQEIDMPKIEYLANEHLIEISEMLEGREDLSEKLVAHYAKKHKDKEIKKLSQLLEVDYVGIKNAVKKQLEREEQEAVGQS